MPTKTVALDDEAYDILKQQPKGNHSRFVSEAIKVTAHDEVRSLALARSLQVEWIKKSLKACFTKRVGYKTKMLDSKKVCEFVMDLFEVEDLSELI